MHAALGASNELSGMPKRRGLKWGCLVRGSVRILILASVFCSLQMAAAAADTGRLQCTVKDDKGRLAYATAILSWRRIGPDSEAKNVEVRAKITTDGIAEFDNLQPGFYDLVVFIMNEAKARSLIQIRNDQTAQLDVVLNVLEHPAAVVHYDTIPVGGLERANKFLAAMNEPPLCGAAQSKTADHDTYRLLWLRTFDRPILFKISFLSDQEASVTYKETDGQGGYEIGKLAANEAIDGAKVLAKKHGASAVPMILKFIREDEATSGFWQLPAEIDDGSITTDGSEWIIEGKQGEKCKVVARSNPEWGDFKKFAEQLIRISGKRFYHDEYY